MENSRHGIDSRWQNIRVQCWKNAVQCWILRLPWDKVTHLHGWWVEQKNWVIWICFGTIPSSQVFSHSLTLSGMALTERQRRCDLKQDALWSLLYHFHSVTMINVKLLNVEKSFGYYYSEWMTMNYTSIVLTKSILLVNWWIERRKRNCDEFQEGV